MKTCQYDSSRSYINRDGSALITVMILSAVLMIAGLSITFLTSNASFTSRKLHTGARALAIAEAGISDQLMHMSINDGAYYNYWASSGVANVGNIDGGTYVVTVTSTSTTPNLVVTSIGTVAGESRTTVVELMKKPDFYGALIAGGNITFKGAAPTIYGDIYANGCIYKDSGASEPTVIGDASCAGATIDIDATGTETTGVYPPASVSDIMSTMTNEKPYAIQYHNWFAAYSNASDYRVVGDKTWNGEDLEPTNGIIFVSGNATISGHSSLKGILVATKSITIGNNFYDKYNPPAYDPTWTVSLIAGENITCNNRNAFPGMMFAGLQINIQNSTSVTGKLVALGSIYVENSATVNPATNTASGYPAVVIGGWVQ
ncbi:MAG: pilus assembly PilX N-terminal domain-containing protein [Kiritimatiellae bacterium]|nr:pilus assembly PilX N-terminal domain-containing protein [Kiritimatiellia bacterium]